MFIGQASFAKKEEKTKYTVRRKGVYTDPILAGTSLGAVGAAIGGVTGVGLTGRSLVKKTQERALKGRKKRPEVALRYLTKVNKLMGKSGKVGALIGGALGATAGVGVAKLANKKNKQDKRKTTTGETLRTAATIGAIGAGAYGLSRLKLKQQLKDPKIAKLLSTTDDVADSFSGSIPLRTKSRAKDAAQDYAEKATKMRVRLDNESAPDLKTPALKGTGTNPVPSQKTILTEAKAREELEDWAKTRKNKIMNAQNRDVNTANNYSKSNHKLVRNLLVGAGTLGGVSQGSSLYGMWLRNKRQKEDDEKAVINTRIGKARVIL